MPAEAALLANYPNPFNPETWIPFTLAEPASVTIRIYDQLGALVRALELGARAAGAHIYPTTAGHWDGRDRNGELVASGVYVYRIEAGDFVATRRMTVAK